jgi:hypothetical protein
MPPAYLAACAMYRNDARYLAEWIEFHRLVGVERFFLYDNMSTDDHHEVLEPYVASGVVVPHERNVPFSFDVLVETARQCMAEHRDDARWITYLDVDEFLFSPTGGLVSGLLPEYEQWPAVYVQRLNFGSSGHITRPDGLVIENFVTRRRRSPNWVWGQVKVVADPRRFESCDSPHYFAYTDGIGVDEQKRPIDPGGAGPPVSFETLRVNHYVIKSEHEYEEKVALWNEGDSPRTYADKERANWDELNEQRDDAITRYAPALRDALRRSDRA